MNIPHIVSYCQDLSDANLRNQKQTLVISSRGCSNAVNRASRTSLKIILTVPRHDSARSITTLCRTLAWMSKFAIVMATDLSIVVKIRTAVTARTSTRTLKTSGTKSYPLVLFVLLTIASPLDLLFYLHSSW